MSTPTPPTPPSPILRQRQARRFLDENTANWYQDFDEDGSDVFYAHIEEEEEEPSFSAPTLVELADKVAEHLGKPIT